MTGEKNRVRLLAPADAERWRELFAAFNVFYRATVPEDVVALVWRRLLSDAPGTHVGLVAVDADDRPIGFAHLLFHASTWTAADYCYLEDLYVDEAARGRGVGQALIGATYALADSRQAARVYWMTHETNAVARRLYDRVGVDTGFVKYQR